MSEPDRGHRSWKRNRDAQKPIPANRRRIRAGAGGSSGCYVRKWRWLKGDLRTCWLAEDSGVSTSAVKRRSNKRILSQAAAFSLGLLMRGRFGFGTPQSLQAFAATQTAVADYLYSAISSVISSSCCDVAVLSADAPSPADVAHAMRGSPWSGAPPPPGHNT